MRFQYNGKFYAIWFEHHTDKGTEALPRPRYTGCTIAEITGPKEAKELITDDAFCADCDNFCKAVGRKIALGRALCKLTDDKQFRRTAWMAYLNRGKADSRVIDVTPAEPKVREAKPLAVISIDSARA